MGCIESKFVISDVDEDLIQYCLLCNQELNNKLVYCRNCQYTIGHVDCIYQLQKCPICKFI